MSCGCTERNGGGGGGRSRELSDDDTRTSACRGCRGIRISLSGINRMGSQFSPGFTTGIRLRRYVAFLQIRIQRLTYLTTYLRRARRRE